MSKCAKCPKCGGSGEAPTSKPTIAELEAILNSPDVKVEILPSGEVRCSDAPPVPKRMSESSSFVEVEVGALRRSFAAAFDSDPDFEATYRANVAMLLCDRYGIKEYETRNRAAQEILDLIFRDKR